MTHQDNPVNTGVNEERTTRQPSHVRLPAFVTDDDIGLGDVVKRVTGAVGLHPCRSCERRATALNRWLVFAAGSSGRRQGR
ncbi:hypothetical protein [Streptomyces sp. NPDC048357]|uniref:hypothetical protein n=1 Tax=Streptomyces sp. NPDC048357 TaxID=3154719 RepID=UPI003436E45D